MSKNFNAFDLLVMAERRYGEPEVMLTRNLWYDTFDKLKIDKKPTIQELEKFFSQPPYAFSTIFHSLKLKYRALTTEPSIIEKTMSPFQLYQARNPLWKQNISGYNISCVKYGQKKFDNKNLFLTEDDFKVLSCCTNTYTVDCHVEYRLKNRKD